MNEQLRQAMADAAGVELDSHNETIGDVLLLASSSTRLAPGFSLSADEVLGWFNLQCCGKHCDCLKSVDELVALSWNILRRHDKRKWVCA